MKKVERFLYLIIIVVLLGFLSAVGTYIALQSKNNNVKNNNHSENNKTPDKDNSTKLEDSIKFVSTKTNNDEVIKSFKIVLNGKESNINVKFIKEKFEGEQFIRASFKEKEIYAISNNYYEDSEQFQVNKVAQDFDESKFRIIRGIEGKNYLIVLANVNTSNYFYVFNDNMELVPSNIKPNCGPDGSFPLMITISHYDLKDNKKPWYKDSFDFCTDENCEIRSKIENNMIYTLVSDIHENIKENDIGTLEERVYTINNNKLEYKVINNYKIVNGAGGLC